MFFGENDYIAMIHVMTYGMYSVCSKCNQQLAKG